jgi:hypothetical protein
MAAGLADVSPRCVTNSAVRERAAWSSSMSVLAWTMVASVAFNACSSAHDNDGKVAAVTLRFRPEPGQHYREHWVYDLEAPGLGSLRTGLSFDVNVAPAEQSSLALQQSLRRSYRAKDGVPQAPAWQGMRVSSLWGGDRSLLGDLTVDHLRGEAARAAHDCLAAARFATLIEYPDQAVSVGDSWSIEPRTLPVGPGIVATLRPTYTIQSIEHSGDERVAVIGTDIQVDLLRSEIDPTIGIEGGGTASGTLRVRVRDGVLLDARAVLHFNQELLVSGSEVLGYREFSATAHIFTSALSVQPNLAAEPHALEPPDAEEQRECAGLLESAAERVGRAPVETRMYLVGALHAQGLAAAYGGAALHESGTSLLLSADPKHIELDGIVLEPRELPKALHDSHAPSDPLYVFVEASLPLDRLRNVLPLLPRDSSLRLVVRDAADDTAPPKAPHWLEEQLRAALSAPTPSERQNRLEQLLADHLVLCEPALEALRKVQSAGQGYSALPARIVNAFVKCGCTTTNLDGLEATLYAMFGSPDLRFLRLPRGLDEHRLAASASVADLVRVLAGRDARGERGDR